MAGREKKGVRQPTGKSQLVARFPGGRQSDLEETRKKNEQCANEVNKPQGNGLSWVFFFFFAFSFKASFK